MNILVFSQAAWDPTNSLGNTVSNFFDGWETDRFSHFYTRKQLPKNAPAELYYNLSALDILKSVCKQKTIPARFSKADIPKRAADVEKAHEKEQQNIDKIHKKKHSLLYWITEQIWLSKFWQNRSFQAFIRESDPDIFFAFAANSFLLWPLMQYLKKHTRAKIVLFAADDIHNYNSKLSFFRRCYLIPTLEKCIRRADLVYAISPGLCEKYSRLFHREVRLLLKGCDFEKPVSDSIHSPLTIAYAGNLYYGRDEILARIAGVLEKINREGTRACLQIYTPATITEQLRCSLHRPPSSQIMGARPYEEIKEILHEADIVLHVESFEEAQIDYVRNSFSTKIIDCLQSGSGVLAVGPAGITSVEYLRAIPGTTVIDDLNSLETQLCEMLDRAETIPENAEKIREYALSHHELKNVRQNLRRDFQRLLEEG